VRAYRKTVTEADIGDPTPSFPANPTLALPVVVPTGIFERLNNLVEQIRAADGYTPETGAILGIVPQAEGADALVPDLKADALPEFEIEVNFVRGKSDGIAVQIQRDKETTWTSFGSYFQSPATLEVPPKIPDTPEVVRLRGRFLEGNQPTGDFSDIVEIVTKP